jgi:RNA polymerase sigma-70 factor (ECF subfamily)
MSERLTRLFVGAAGQGASRFAALPDLEARLVRAVEAGRAAWPKLPLAEPDYVAHLAACVRAAKDPAAALERAHAADLWLACACAKGVQGAAEALERHFFGGVAKAVSGLDSSPTFADEVRSSLREKLLLGRGSTGPAIATYSGEGPLAGWLRIAARRAALNLRSRKELPAASDDELLAARSALPDPEVEHLRDKYRAEFRAAFLAAMGELQPRDRLLLRQHYVDGLSGARIAELQGVAPSTVTRALQAARGTLQAGARRHLEERLRLSASQIDSLAGLVLSRLDVSLPGALSGAAPKGTRRPGAR